MGSPSVLPAAIWSMVLAAAIATSHSGAAPQTEMPFVTAVDKPIRSLFPPTTADTSGEPAAALLFESLLERHWSDDRFVASLARKWEVSKDKLTYTFWLDPAARFWDGSPVTPEDVQFSHQVFELDGVDGEPWFTHYIFIKQVLPKGKDQVVFTVQRASWAHFAAVATMKIYQKKHYMKLYRADKTLRGPASQREAMGSGAWQVEALEAGELRLVRNAKYWARKRHEKEGRWTYARRTLRFYQTPDERLAALARGELSYLNLTKEQWIALHEPGPPPKGPSFIQAENLVPQPYDFIGWNHKHPALFATPVRWAMTHLIDLAAWIERFDRGLTRPTLGPLGPRAPYDDSTLLPPRLDLDEARRRLAAAGWVAKDGDGWLIKDGQRLDVEIVYPALGPGQYGPKIFQMAEAGKKIGVHIIPKSASWAEIEQRIAKNDFGGVVMSRTRTTDATIRRLLHQDYVKDGDNFVNFRSERASSLIDRLDAAFDPTERQRLGRELQKLIYTLQPYSFLTEYRYALYGREARIRTPAPSLPYQIGVAFWRL